MKLKNDQYNVFQKEIVLLNKELESSPCSTKKQKDVEQQLQEIETQLKFHNQAMEKKAQQSQHKEIISELIIKTKNLRLKQKETENKLALFSSLKKDIDNLQEQDKKIQKYAKELNIKKEDLLRQKGQLDNQIEKLKTIEKEYKALEKKNKEFLKAREDYHAIASAMGKDGIQALLIEEILPELEQETNNLLSKLTENQSHIIIESLRDLKKGGTKETLDIKISDSLGVRPYEMFSGGEAFRIDFALRIALSKLLAQRSGTSLQTLIIDEGFGSQDDEGLSKIMDALYRIQGDFKKIIVVSHLGALKDQFPVHFVIEKKSNGSTINVIENG